MNSHNEVAYQKAVHQFLSDPALVLSTESGKRLQILSPGRINPHEGPDFRDMAILLDGMIMVGDGEFHKRSSEWKSHNHSGDFRYKNIILHIVLEVNDSSYAGETLKLQESDVNPLLDEQPADTLPDINSIEDLQHFALLRLLRKTSEAQKLLNNYGLKEAFKMSVLEFLNRYNAKRRRPGYTKERLLKLIENIHSSKASAFLEAVYNTEDISVQDHMQELLRVKLTDEGAHLRREILLNCVLPMALCASNEEKRIDLFLWFWSTPALVSYGMLTRRFPSIPQNFLWQQQGMLEYIKDFGAKPGMVAEKETIKNYGFAEILSFYKIAGATMHPLEYGGE